MAKRELFGCLMMLKKAAILQLDEEVYADTDTKRIYTVRRPVGALT